MKEHYLNFFKRSRKIGKRGWSAFMAVLFLFAFISPLFANVSTVEQAKEEDIDSLTLEQLLSVEIIPVVRENLWKFTMLLTLRIYGENLNFPKHKKKLRIATDTERFLRELERKDYGIRKIPLEGVLISPKDEIDPERFDLVFVRSKKLAKKFAGTGKTLVFSNKKTSAAAFAITVSGSQLKIYSNEKTISAQGAEYSERFINAIDARKRKNRERGK